MLTIRDHQTGDLFDPRAHLGVKRRRLLDRSRAAVSREHLLAHLPVRELAAHFSRDPGRPTEDLHAGVGALILQPLHDTTDAETVEAVALNLAWQYALDIRADTDAYLCERTPRSYRQLLIGRGLDQVLFRTPTDRLIEATGVDTSKRRLDSTAIRSAMRGLTRLGIIVESVSKLLREPRRLHPALFGRVDPEAARKDVDREGTGCFASTRPGESRRRRPEAAADLLLPATQFRDPAASGLESDRILALVLAEQREVVADPESGPHARVKDPEEIACGDVLSPADPDATFNTHRGVGYLVRVMEAYAGDEASPSEAEASAPPKPDLITRVAVGPLNAHDGAALDPAPADTEARGIEPRVMLGDSRYGPEEDPKEAAPREVEVIAPAMPPEGSKRGRITPEDFALDVRGHVTLCPGGQAPLSTSEGADRIQASFDPSACDACRLRASCPASAVGRDARRGASGTRATGSAIASAARASGRRGSGTATAGGRGSRGRCRG